MYYSEQQLRDFLRELDTVPQKQLALLFAYNDRQYQTARGREFAVQGFLRRLGTLRHCINRVFELLPPALQDIPTDEACTGATIALQAFIFNVFGCMDNLAWVWIEESSVRKLDGTPLAQNAIGLGAKYTRVRHSFSEAFRAYLQTREDWFAHLEGYRHALAHRIPLYIPPHAVAPDNEAEYLSLAHQISDAVLAANPALESSLRQRQRELMFFRPWMTHSFEERAPIAVIHPQMLADFNTVEEVACRMLSELNHL
jgi:hypothetical protein